MENPNVLIFYSKMRKEVQLKFVGKYVPVVVPVRG